MSHLCILTHFKQYLNTQTAVWEFKDVGTEAKKHSLFSSIMFLLFIQPKVHCSYTIAVNLQAMKKHAFPEANIVEYSCPSQVKSIIFPLFYNIPCPIVTLHPFCCLSRASQKMVKGGHCFHCEYMISCFVSAQTRLLSGVSQNSAALQIVPFQSQTIHLVPFKVAFGVVRYCKKKAKDGNSDSVKSVLSPQGHQGTEIDLDLKRKGRVKMATPALV